MNDEVDEIAPLRSRVVGVSEYAQRIKLHNELHARPHELLKAPMQVSQLVLLSDNSMISDELRLITQLCERYSVSPPVLETRHFSAQFGSFRFKWERHTEFSMYTFFVKMPFEVPFAEPAIKHVPKEWLETLPGEILSATHLAIEHKSRPQRNLEALSTLFASNTVIGAKVVAGSAIVWTDNKIHADGFSRILIHDVDLRRRQAGRLVQRLLEVETYRMLALIPVSTARKYLPELANFDKQLAELTDNNCHCQSHDDEQQLLDDLTRLAAEIERISAVTNQRFNASSAYYNIVKMRISELREQRIQGLQMFHEFMEQRLSPAMATCDSVNSNLELLSTRVARASALLRTRVDIAMEGQTRDLLTSMDKRAKLQLRMQETVEGLSVVVLSYYLLGMVGYALKALKSSGVSINVEISTGLAIPVVLGIVFISVRRLRRLASDD
ncbi:MAG: DUF3422 domain-containing protein [Gammaproteobacteria bacterium]|nr:DUF3422 domain-containing protein [Gammaproteobacteria bacterium]